MPTDDKPSPQPAKDGTGTPDEALPSASDDKVLEEAARLAREGRKELEADPKERKGE
jgi:hypothetical protein